MGAELSAAWRMAALVPLALAACATAPRSDPPADANFPDPASAIWKEGAFPNIQSLGLMRVGMGKDQVRGLLSWPHFTEGVVGVREWNYLFHFRTGADRAFVTCQYMVRFDSDMRTSSLHWRTSACAALADGAAHHAGPAAADATAAPSTLGADSRSANAE